MDELNLRWPMDLPPEWIPAVKQHAENYARSKIEAIVGASEMANLKIRVIGASASDLNLRLQGPPWLLRKISHGWS